MMARLLPYISIVVLLLVMCMAAQPGTGRTPDDEGQDLSGVLPPSLVKLPYLKTIDFTRNYLSGNIPREWASTKLEYLSIIVNNLSGPIPSFLGNITTLVYMSLESNLFSGTVPPELGNLVNLVNLILNANNLTGDLPFALTKLTKLTELRISSNNFTGKMPEFFRSWIHLEKLEIQASGFEGPIPSSISILSNLTELDLSFNRLVGEVPDLVGLTDLEFVLNRLEPAFRLEYRRAKYLTSNLLTGSISSWITGSVNRKWYGF
ncbi:probable leucine-rich repeat receptor-like serine/threonine-protein kinase At3g14840 isoform X2 [Fagus crenata]